MATIRDVLNQKGTEVVTVSPEETIADAIEQLITHKIGSLLVTDGEHEIVGILTERDILRFVHENGQRVRERKVSEFMSTGVVWCDPEDDLDYAMSVMTDRRFRRMPVMHEGKLCGIISIGDIVKALKSEKEYEVRQLNRYITGGYA